MTRATVSKETDRHYFAHQLGDATASLLAKFRLSARHYEWEVGKARSKPTPSMELGSAIHCYVLEPDEFRFRYIESPMFDRRTKSGKAAAEEFSEEHADLTVLSTSQMRTVREAGATVRGMLLPGGTREHVVRWEEAGCRCKAKVDLFYDNGLLIDLKTMRDASPRGARRSIWNYSYQYQMAFYRRALRMLGHEMPRVRIVAIEPFPPYAVAVYELRADELDTFEGEIAEDLYRLGEATAANVWPGYNGGEVYPLSLYQTHESDDEAEDDIEALGLLACPNLLWCDEAVQ